MSSSVGGVNQGNGSPEGFPVVHAERFPLPELQASATISRNWPLKSWDGEELRYEAGLPGCVICSPRGTLCQAYLRARIKRFADNQEGGVEIPAVVVLEFKRLNFFTAGNGEDFILSLCLASAVILPSIIRREEITGSRQQYNPRRGTCGSLFLPNFFPYSTPNLSIEYREMQSGGCT